MPFDSPGYWEARYGRGGNSGPGSYGKYGEFKAAVLSTFIASRGVTSVVEFGSGDGHVLSLTTGVPDYLGVDLSAVAVAACRAKFAGVPARRFITKTEYAGERADLAMSLDVIQHLVEDDDFEAYMRRLFGAADRFVATYSSNVNGRGRDAHVRFRHYSKWIARELPEWEAFGRVPSLWWEELDQRNRKTFVFWRRRGALAP